MKKMLMFVLIIAALLSTPLQATEDPYPDWDWVVDHWEWVGSGNPGYPPPPPPGNK